MMRIPPVFCTSYAFIHSSPYVCELDWFGIKLKQKLQLCMRISQSMGDYSKASPE